MNDAYFLLPVKINIPVATIMMRWYGEQRLNIPPAEQRSEGEIRLCYEIIRITHCLRQLISQDTFEFVRQRRSVKE